MKQLYKFRWIILGVISITFLVILLVSMGNSEEVVQTLDSSCQEQKDIGITRGKCAPDFKLQTLNGNNISLKYDKPTVISFWTTWCNFCKQEMPFWQNSFNSYKSKVNILLINVTSLEADELKPQQMMKSSTYTFPVALDITGTVSQNYGVLAVPATYFINKHGEIVDVHKGFMNQRQIQNKIAELVDL